MVRVVECLWQAVLAPGGAGASDEKLLDLYVSRRDQAAFAALVQRHGPMVWGVCRRVLGSHHDAEDAFQATFLVLARKAAAIASRDLLANWLYGVAHNTAIKARAMTTRRRFREKQAIELHQRALAEPDQDLTSLLDQELSRLPDKYRMPIVLCDLEGRTRKQAAEQLGWPEGTVAGRLARARTLLANRLGRYGLAVSRPLSVAALVSNASSGAVPPPVLSSTIQAAALFAAGSQTATGLSSGKAAALAEGVIKTMLLTKLCKTPVLLLAASLLVVGVGTGGWIYQIPAAAQRAAVLHDNHRPANGVAANDSPQKKETHRPADPRSRRILRWKITFDSKDGNDYLKHLDALGAVLAIRSPPGGNGRVIRNLNQRPPRPTIEDLAGIQHIYWVEHDEKSVSSLATALGLKPAPESFVMFLPRFIEDEMLRKELAFAHRKEEEIAATTFRFSRTDTGYELKVIAQEAKPPDRKPGRAAVQAEELAPAPGHIWVVPPKGPATGSSWAMGMNGPPDGWKGGVWTLRGIVGATAEDGNGDLVIVLVHRPAECFTNYRLVAFDSAGKRYLFDTVSAAVGGGIKLERFTLDARLLPAKKVEYVGLELLLPGAKTPEAAQPEQQQ